MSLPESASPEPTFRYAAYVRFQVFWDPSGREEASYVDQQLCLLLDTLQPLCSTNETCKKIHSALSRHKDRWTAAQTDAENAWGAQDVGVIAKNGWAQRCMEKLKPLHDEICKDCAPGLINFPMDHDVQENLCVEERTFIEDGMAWALMELIQHEEVDSRILREKGLTSGYDLLEKIQNHVTRVFHAETDIEPQAVPRQSEAESQSSSRDTSRAGSPIFSEHSSSSDV